MENVNSQVTTRQTKSLQELTFKDNFMFAAVLMDEANAKAVLEQVLDIKIDHVVVSKEENIVFNPDYKGVRLDVYIKDENNTHFDVEMQNSETSIEKRSRYYHSMIDTEILDRGVDYKNLPNAYVIFFCDYDPLKLGKYKYSIKKTLVEDESFEYKDGEYTVFLSTKGKNEDEVGKDLITFLKYVGADEEHANDDYDSELVKQLQNSVAKIKVNREWGKRYMNWKELREQDYNDGKAEGIVVGKIDGKIDMLFILLNAKGTVSAQLKNRILSVKDAEALNELALYASKVETVEAFEAELTEMGY